MTKAYLNSYLNMKKAYLNSNLNSRKNTFNMRPYVSSTFIN